MIKWVVGVLVLANLALFGWMKWGNQLTEDKDAVALQAALNPDKIRLLPLLASSAAASAPQAATSGVPLTLVSAPVAASTVAATSAVPAPASAPVVVPVPVASAPVPAPAPVPHPAQTAKPTSCAEWGEFSGEDLTRSQQALSTLKLGDKLTQRIVEQDHGFWVYLPPLKRRTEVEKKVAQLKSFGITDYFVVQEKGQWHNAISLGVFKNREGAENYLQEMRAKKVRSAKVGERKIKLHFTVFALKGLDAATVEKLNGLKKDFPDSELKVSACGN